jgi:hypothetical protein
MQAVSNAAWLTTDTWRSATRSSSHQQQHC